MKELRIGNAIICITRPDLAAAERAKREKGIITALHQYGKAEKAKG